MDSIEELKKLKKKAEIKLTTMIIEELNRLASESGKNINGLDISFDILESIGTRKTKLVISELNIDIDLLS